MRTDLGLIAVTTLILAAGCQKPTEPTAAAPPAEAPPAAPPPAAPPAPIKGHPVSQPASAPAQPEEPPPPIEPRAGAPLPKSPYTFDALAPGAICTYTLRDISNEELGGDFYAGRELEVAYVLRSEKVKDGIAMSVEVETVTAKGRLEDIKLDLDSSRPSDIRRISGGGDAIELPEVVAYFAMLGQKLTIHTDDRGRFTRLDGGDAIRKRFLGYHPPRPRKNPHFIAKAKMRLSDEAIAERFLPVSTTIFEKGDLTSGRTDNETFDVFEPDHRAKARRARRIADDGKKILLQTKWGFAPTKEKNTVPPDRDAILQDFLGGEGSELIALEPQNPCFLQAARTRVGTHTWDGLVKGEPIKTERKLVRTQIWRKKAG